MLFYFVVFFARNYSCASYKWCPETEQNRYTSPRHVSVLYIFVVSFHRPACKRDTLEKSQESQKNSDCQNLSAVPKQIGHAALSEYQYFHSEFILFWLSCNRRVCASVSTCVCLCAYVQGCESGAKMAAWLADSEWPTASAYLHSSR